MTIVRRPSPFGELLSLRQAMLKPRQIRISPRIADSTNWNASSNDQQTVLAGDRAGAARQTTAAAGQTTAATRQTTARAAGQTSAAARKAG